MPACSLESATPEDMLDVYNTNLVGPMLVTKEFLPLLRKAARSSSHKGMGCGKAAIVNMSTVLGSIEKAPEHYSSFPVVSYRCSKHMETHGDPILHVTALDHAERRGKPPLWQAAIPMFPVPRAGEIGTRRLIPILDPFSGSPSPMPPAHGSAVAALNMLTKLQSMGYKEEGILCVAIHPGWVKTDLGTDKADLTVEESVKGIMDVICNLSDKQHGILVTWEGKTLPW
ncbi:hypothetical protein JD844_000018 [Phrynosoma platyrhinos]|uniref:C-factor n=1 Tax=Phrynosoma platyrhinos TaxID=52577 RepID=A0ABQ7SPV3_PHRPL|nr:hypothetical protein JD844_000018 [Phrynosoma platyrhinos]